MIYKIKTEHLAVVPDGYVLSLAKEDTEKLLGLDQKGSHHTSGPVFIQYHFCDPHTRLLRWNHTHGAQLSLAPWDSTERDSRELLMILQKPSSKGVLRKMCLFKGEAFTF